MKISTHRFQVSSGSRLIAAAAMLTVVASVMSATTSPAYAGRPRPTPIPAPTATPVPVPTSVPVPTALQVTFGAPDDFQIQISPATQLGDAEFISGPTVGGPAIVSAYDNGVVVFGRLVENSDYVFRYRNKIYIPSSQSFITSPWVQFSFHTPTFDSLRPAAPQNLRVVERTASTVTVRWDAVPTAVSYNFSLNGVGSILTGSCGGPYCDRTDPLTATFARPAAGTSVLFSVTAARAPVNCAYCQEFNRFITSLPATLVVTN